MNLRKYLGFAFGPIAAAALGLVTVPLAAWVFSPADIGRLNVWQITLSFALLLSVLGLDQAYVREYHESANRPQLLRACFLPGFLLLLFLGLASSFFAAPLAQWLYDDANPWWFWATLAGMLLAYVARFLSLILRMQERGWAYSASQVLPKVLQILLILSIAYASFGKSFSHLVLITLATSSLVVLVYAWNTRRDWRVATTTAKIAPQELRKLLAFGSPLVVSGLAYWGLSATSTIALRTWSSLDELALYAVSNSFASAAIVFQSIFTTIWAPTVYKWVSEGGDMLRIQKISQQAIMAALALLGLIGLSTYFIDYLLPPHYHSVKFLIMGAMLPPILYTLSEITGIGIGISRKTSQSIYIASLALTVNICTTSVLVPRMGAAGAVLSNIFSYTIFFIAKTEISSRVYKKIPRLSLYLAITLATSMAALTIFSRSVAISMLAAVTLLFVTFLFFAKSRFIK